MLDATVSGINSNSYVTVDEANAYFEYRLHSEAWNTSVTKEAALITATSIIDWFYVYRGKKTVKEQALQWPRTGITVDEEELPGDVIPREIKQAAYEIALLALTSDLTADSDLAGLRKIQAGPLLIQTAENGIPSASKSRIPEAVLRLLKRFTDYSSGIRIVRLYRG